MTTILIDNICKYASRWKKILKNFHLKDATDKLIK